MNASPILWPRKTRDIHNRPFDSTTWDDFAFRDDDVMIAAALAA